MKLSKLSLIFSAIILSFPAHALESDYQQQVKVTSGQLRANMKSNTVIYEKKVLLTQGTIKITGEKLTVIRGDKPNHEVMVAEGDYATFYQRQDDGKPLDAQAKSIRYDVASAKITLAGNAQVKQLDSKITGSKITYFLETEELVVESDKENQQRVQTVFLPAQLDKNSKKEIETEIDKQAEDK